MYKHLIIKDINMEAHIQKWGNSLGVRIPAKVARQLHLTAGKPVDFKIEKDHLAIYPREYQLEEMLKAINKHNIHNEVFIEDVAGKESW